MSDSAFDQGKIQLIVDDCLLDCAGIFDRYIDFDFRVLLLIGFDKGTLAAEGAAAEPEDQQLRYDGEGPCPWCGITNWTTKEQEYE